MSAFFAMGGYAAYVWPAYAVSAVGIASAVVLVARAYAKAKARLKALEERA